MSVHRRHTQRIRTELNFYHVTLHAQSHSYTVTSIAVPEGAKHSLRISSLAVALNMCVSELSEAPEVTDDRLYSTNRISIQTRTSNPSFYMRGSQLVEVASIAVPEVDISTTLSLRISSLAVILNICDSELNEAPEVNQDSTNRFCFSVLSVPYFFIYNFNIPNFRTAYTTIYDTCSKSAVHTPLSWRFGVPVVFLSVAETFVVMWLTLLFPFCPFLLFWPSAGLSSKSLLCLSALQPPGATSVVPGAQ